MILATTTPNGSLRLEIGMADYTVDHRPHHYVSEALLRDTPRMREQMEAIGMEFVLLHDRRPVEVWAEPKVWGADNR